MGKISFPNAARLFNTLTKSRSPPNNIRPSSFTAVDVARREAVLQTYRTFDPIEIDTSHLTRDTVLETVLNVLHRSGVC